MNPIRTSIIIVAADSGPVLRDCVNRALEHGGVGTEVVLIDNASTDGVPEAIERAHADDDRLQVTYARRNLGFGAAANLAERKASGEVLLILNPDCLLEADTLPQLLQVLDRDPHIGLVGAVICNGDGEVDPASFRRDPLLRRSLNTLTGRARRESDEPEIEGVNVNGPMPEDAVDVEAVSGALMLLRRHAFERVGGFDEGYFLHCEDLDLCRRLRDERYRVMLAGHVRVQHVGGSSSRHRPVFVSRHKHRGMWRWFRKFDPAARNPLVALVVWCGLWGHFLLQWPSLAVSRLRHR